MPRREKLFRFSLFAAVVIVATAGAAWAQEDSAAAAAATIDETLEAHSAGFIRLWTLIAAAMVFLMQAGFALLEAGFTRAKNACNIIMKNIMDFSTGVTVFFLVGFGLMFGATEAGYIGAMMPGLTNVPGEIDEPWLFTFFVFQAVFAGTACTIVSGAMAERTKFIGYLMYSALICLIIYPVFGKWAWGSLLLGDDGAGFLEGLGFADFAGSTVVHSVGGWAALAGAIVLGPRLGKFLKGRPVAIPGHSIPLAALGMFILWFGWYGFNAGSTTDGASGDLGIIAITTTLSAVGAVVSSMVTSWVLFKKPDTGMTINGALAGLVGITAGCNVIAPLYALIVGLFAGVLVVLSVLFIERILKVDDPVGAVSVHGVCGVWGTLAVGIFGGANLGVQALGCLLAFAWTFSLAFVFFFALKKLGLLRASEEDEMEGLDYSEHANEAYATPSFGPGGSRMGAAGMASSMGYSPAPAASSEQAPA